MANDLHSLIISVLNEGFERDAAQQELVRGEIKQRGTYWAGTEIWELRRTVATLRKRLAEYEGKQ